MAQIKLRDRFFTEAQERGWGSDAAIADRIGAERTTVWRVRNGHASPGEQFIAGVLAAMPDMQFGDLFDIEQVTSA